MAAIQVVGLGKRYRVPVKGEGFRAAVASLFRRQYREVGAVRAVTFRVDEGEVVGFIGPNGAGKTTTLKMLSGVLHPTEGRAEVLGHRPWDRNHGFLRQIAYVRGSRPLAVPGELTVLDALRFQQLVYEVEESQFRRHVQELSDLLDLAALLPRQVRALSLGERMRCGLAWSLLHRPRLLFLDEPTIGLDVSAAVMMRRFIAAYSAETGATILLTSHYMADVDTLCRRILLIDKGALTYDGDRAELTRRLTPFKLLRVAVEGAPDWNRYGEVLQQQGAETTLRVPWEQVPVVTARLLAELAVVDLAVEEPPLESVIDQIYRGVGA